MKPTQGRVVLYTRGPGETFSARITRVWMRPEAVDQPQLAQDEASYNVLLAVDIVREECVVQGKSLVPTGRFSGGTWFTPAPVRFADEPIDNTWRWPPKV